MTHDKIMATYKTLTKRIDSLGVTEPEITIEGNDKIRVKLAGVTNPEEARQQLSTVATLSFRDADDNLLMSSDVLVSGGAKVNKILLVIKRFLYLLKTKMNFIRLRTR